YTLADGDVETISQICRLVEGMPLAIELAAGWLHVLSLQEILAELDQNPDLLYTDMRDVPHRHRSIRTVFEHTWSLLNPAEQHTFMQLAVFRGGFTREAAQAVTGASIQSLASLVDKSVVRYRTQRRRFEIHELLRQYAQEQLENSPGESQAVQQRHAAFFADFSNERWDDLRGRRQRQGLNQIEADIENIRSAWRYYLQYGHAEQLGRFLHPLWIVYWIKGWNRAAVELFRSAVAALDIPGPTRAQEIVSATSRANLAFFMSWLGMADEALPVARESAAQLEELRDFYGLLSAYNGLSLAAYYLGDLKTEKEATDRLLELARSVGDPWALTYALSLSATSSLFPGEYAEAKELAEAGIKQSAEVGEYFSSLISILTLGQVAQVDKDYPAAREHYERALGASRQLGFFWGIENATKYLGQIAYLEGNYAEAETRFIDSLKIAYDFGLNRDIANHLYEFARLRAFQGNQEEAVALLALLLRLPASRQTRLGEGSIRASARSLLEGLEPKLPPEQFSSAVQRGAEMDFDETLRALIDLPASAA
ncbi:MAG: hypothetical protein R3335_05840, partial [Anaerolineales bacterium]|nr:hypothetical protein [Anaerolineales bacterium]